MDRKQNYFQDVTIGIQSIRGNWLIPTLNLTEQLLMKLYFPCYPNLKYTNSRQSPCYLHSSKPADLLHGPGSMGH